MKAKVADVVIKVEGYASSFSQYEIETKDSLSAGHLSAQIDRFAKLWRVHFFIEREEKKRIEPWIRELKEAVSKFALGQLQPHEIESPEAVVKDIANRLTLIETSPWYGKAVRNEPITAKYHGEKAAKGMYPFGAPSIQSYIENEPTESRT